jgi:hypothetical protein
MPDTRSSHRRVAWPPDRLLVSPGGITHLPACRTLGAHPGATGWGELAAVNDAIETLMMGLPVRSHVPGGDTAGPIATRLCRRCLNGF